MIKFGVGASVVGAILVIALAGCAPAVHPHHSAHGPGPTASATRTPIPTKPALADIVLSPDGLGDVVLNAPVPPTTFLFTYNATECVSTETGVTAGSPFAGAWRAAYPAVDPANPDQLPFILSNTPQTTAGPVTYVWVWSPGVHTAAGIQVGSTRAEVLAAYPHADAVTHGVLSDVYVITGSVGKLVIEVARADSGDVGYWPPGQVDTVLWMGAVQHSDPAPAIAGTDGGPSTCPTNA